MRRPTVSLLQNAPMILDSPPALAVPPRWSAAVVAALLAFNLAAFKVATPAACRSSKDTVKRVCCLTESGCCCSQKAKGDRSELPSGTLCWRAAGCGEAIAAGLIHGQWDPVVLLEVAAALDQIDGTIGSTDEPPRLGEEWPPPTPPPQIA